VDDRRERLDREGLGQAGHAFEEDVAVGEQADEQPLDHVTLADDDLAHFALERRDERALLADEFREFADASLCSHRVTIETASARRKFNFIGGSLGKWR
jgi:hypothetical protein